MQFLEKIFVTSFQGFQHAIQAFLGLGIGREILLQADEKELVVHVGGNHVVLDIGNQLIDELQVIDILLNEHFLMEVEPDPVGEFFKEKLLPRIQAGFGGYFEEPKDRALTEEWDPLGERLISPDGEYHAALRFIRPFHESQVTGNPMLPGYQSISAGTDLLQSRRLGLNDIEAAFDFEEFPGHQHADKVEYIKTRIFLSQIKKSGESLFLLPFEIIIPIPFLLVFHPLINDGAQILSDSFLSRLFFAA
jgi:hypothetical protein